MKNNVKKVFVSVLGASLIAASNSLAVNAVQENEKMINVDLRIEGIENCIYCGNLTYVSDSETAVLEQFLRYADESEESFDITWSGSEYGAYINAVNGVNYAVFNAWDVWMYRVNGISPSEGVSEYKIKDGDEIVVYYGYMDENTFVQYPKMHFNAAKNVIEFTSMDTSYDAEWNPVVTQNPVAGLTVEIKNGDSSFTAVTDEKGIVDMSLYSDKISELGMNAGKYKVAYHKENENGAPMVLRSAPNAEITFGYTFGDVNFDGKIDSDDASTILSIYAKNATSQDTDIDRTILLAANVNEDASVDSDDASIVLSYYAYRAVGGTDNIEDYLRSR